MEALKMEKPKNVSWEYDEGADVLYISFGVPKKALGMDLGSGIVVRYDEKTGDLVGFTIVGVKSVLKPKKK